MVDSAPDYALAAFDKAVQARGTASAPGEAEFGDGAISVPSLSFKFKSPSFLGNRARWVLFLLLLAVAVVALILAWQMVDKTSGSDGSEWIWPPIFTLTVSAFSLGFAYAAVMGFGDVEMSTSIGSADAGTSTFAVLSTVPIDKAADIDTAVQIEAIFSEKIDESTLIATSYILRKESDGKTVATDSPTVEGGTLGRLKPTAPLTAATKYEVEITTAVKTASGTALGTAKTWSFTTAA